LVPEDPRLRPPVHRISRSRTGRGISRASDVNPVVLKQHLGTELTPLRKPGASDEQCLDLEELFQAELAVLTAEARLLVATEG
jgi:hypothetical protein